MWQQIQANKRNSYILIFLMLIVLLLMGVAFGGMTAVYLQIEACDALDYNEIYNFAFNGLFIALFVWLILLISAFINGKNTILGLNHAYKLPKHAHKILENVVEEISIAAGMPKPPEIYVIDTPMPNAFATGMSPKNSAIAVTTGLLTQLDRDELQGVVAHEISHIVNRDTMYMIFAGVMLGTIVVLSEMGLRTFRGGSSSRHSSSKSSGKGEAIIILVCLVLAIILPLCAKILYFAISQRREYLADACAVQFTRYPQGLASALAKISTSVYVYRDADKITSAMYIVHPLDSEIQYKNTYSMFGSLFATHPPTEKRIAVLTKMVGADFNAYNEAFCKVSGKRKPILKKEELYGCKPLSIKKSTKKNVDYQANGIIATASAAAATAMIASSVTPQKDNNEDLKQRKRAADDIIWQANNYIFKQCSCGTKLKFPQDYLGQKINCPHCGAVIEVVLEKNN